MPDSLTNDQATSPHDEEPPEQEYEGLAFEEMDPTGRYGRVSSHSKRETNLPSSFFKFHPDYSPLSTDQQILFYHLSILFLY
jgi:hypothetical protein